MAVVVTRQRTVQPMMRLVAFCGLTAGVLFFYPSTLLPRAPVYLLKRNRRERQMECAGVPVKMSAGKDVWMTMPVAHLVLEVKNSLIGACR